MGRTLYAKNGEIHIAYQVIGDGPFDIVLCGGASTHPDLLWEEPGYRRYCEQLASFARLICFDKRGMGRSDRVRIGTLEERMEDVRAVIDAVESRQAAMIGVSEGGPMSMLFDFAYRLQDRGATGRDRDPRLPDRNTRGNRAGSRADHRAVHRCRRLDGIDARARRPCEA